MTAWRDLSLDAKVVGALALGNWMLLFTSHTVVQVSRDGPVWQLFPGLWGAVWLLACALLAAAYPLRDHRLGDGFSTRDRAIHLAAIVVAFVVVPAVAMIVLRETGKPFTYVHDGAIMVEEAARKLLSGQDPYVADYLDTPLFYWPMLNNPALYHFTYFPLFFLITAPFVALFDHFRVFFDVRYLYLPAFVATLLVLPCLIPGDSRPARGWMRSRGAASPVHALALVALVALDPQLVPFVAEGRNDFFVLLPLFAGIALLQRERRALGLLALAAAGALKLHATLLLPFAVAYLWWRDADLPFRERTARLARSAAPAALVMVVTFAPFLAHDLGAFWDDVVAYNAGGSAWSYPISGLGFSGVLLAAGIVSYPQEAFPFWITEALAAVPLAIWSMGRIRRDPRIATVLEGFAITLFAFAWFGRYFNGNHLGFLIAVAAPIPFLRPELLGSAVASLIARARAVAALPPVVPVPVTDGEDVR